MNSHTDRTLILCTLFLYPLLHVVENHVPREATVNHVHITQAPPSRIFEFQDPLDHKPKRHQQKFLQKNTSAADSDAMFALDDFTEDCEPFFESEEDDLSSGELFKLC